MSDVPSDTLLLSPDEAARCLGLPRTRVYDLLRTGELRSSKIGRRRVITRVELDQFVARLTGDLPPKAPEAGANQTLWDRHREQQR